MTDGSVTIEVELTKEQLEKGLKSIKSDLNSLSKTNVGSTLKSIGTVMDNIGKTMTNVGKKITLVTAGMIASLGTAVSRFDTLKNYPKVLSNLGFSAEEAQKSIKELSDGIDGLPTSLDSAASGVQRLVSKNGNIKKSTKYFLAMNDAIVAGNAPAEQQASAIEQLTQAYSKGKFDMMEWRTLMMAMPGQLKQVARAMGYIDTDHLYEALKKGRVSMDDFMDTLVKLDKEGGNGFQSFEKQARNSTDSIGTSITNLGNRIKKGFASILEGIDEMAKGTEFGSIAGMINQFSTSIKNFLDKIGASIKNNKAVKKFTSQLTNALRKLKETIDSLSPEQVDKIVTAFVNIAKAGPALMLIGKGVSILGKFTSKAGSAINIFSSLSGTLGKLGGASAEGASGVGILSKAFTFLKGPVGIVIGIIMAVIGVLILLYKKCEKFRDAVNKAFSTIKEALLQAWEQLKPSLIELWNSIKELLVALKPIGDFLVDILIVAINILVEVLKVLIPIITQIIKVVIQISTTINKVLADVITAVINFFTKTIPDAFNNFINKVREFVDNVINFFSDFPRNLGILIGQAIGHLINFGIQAWSWVTTEVPKIIQGIVNWFAQLPNKIWTWLCNTIQGVINWGNEMANRGRQGAQNVFNSIVDTIQHLPERMLEIGRNIVQGLWNGITGMGGWIKSKIQSFSGGILDGMKNALGIHSPSTVFRDEIGKYLAMGVGEGFEDNISKVYRQMKSAVNFETQKLSANLSTTATMSKIITANINVNGNVEMDSTRVGRLVAPSVTRTIKAGGLA